MTFQNWFTVCSTLGSKKVVILITRIFFDNLHFANRKLLDIKVCEPVILNHTFLTFHNRFTVNPWVQIPNFLCPCILRDFFLKSSISKSLKLAISFQIKNWGCEPVILNHTSNIPKLVLSIRIFVHLPFHKIFFDNLHFKSRKLFDKRLWTGYPRSHFNSIIGSHQLHNETKNILQSYVLWKRLKKGKLRCPFQNFQF